MLLACLLVHVGLSGQKLRYDVFLFGKKIGETTVERRDSAGFRHYFLHNTSRVQLLFMDRKMDISAHVLIGSDGTMASSIYESIKENGKSCTKTIWDKDKLLVEKNGEKKVISSAIKFPSIFLYFFEPDKLQNFFSEQKGQFVDIKKELEGKYSCQINKHVEKYTYSKGKLIQVEMQNSLGSIFMKLVN